MPARNCQGITRNRVPSDGPQDVVEAAAHAGLPRPWVARRLGHSGRRDDRPTKFVSQRPA
jgi:hypothetical protein